MGNVYYVVRDPVDEDARDFDAFHGLDGSDQVDVELVILQNVISEMSLEDFAENPPEKLGK